MADLTTAIALSLEPWTNAKNRFLDSLPDDADRQIFQEASLENLFYTASAGFQHHEFTSKIAKARKKLKPVLESLDGYSKALDVLSQSSASILCPLWGSLRIVLHLALSYEKYYDKIIDMYDRIGDLLPRFRSYQALFPTHPQLLAYLTDAYLEIVKFSYDASRVFALPQGVLMKTFQGSIKHSWKPFKSRFEECIENLRRASENVRQQAEIAHMEASKSHMIESKNFQELVLADRSLQKSADEFRRVRDLLSTYNYRKKHESVRALRCKGTCDWFLRSDRVRSWFEDTATSEPFCCFGIPGSGKTILASTVIDAVIDKRFPHVECEPRIVCYHYCDYAEHITLDATKVVASLTRQLLDLHKSNVPRIVERCRRALDTNFEVAWDDATYCFKEALKTTGRTLLVIDGIDELEAQNQDLLLNEVHRIAHASGGFLKIMLFGRRDERMIRRHLQKAPSFTISTNDNGADLARYIESQLQYYIDRGDLVLQDEAFARAIAERLIIGAEHM